MYHATLIDFSANLVFKSVQLYKTIATAEPLIYFFFPFSVSNLNKNPLSKF